jgi:hypothetical protein
MLMFKNMAQLVVKKAAAGISDGQQILAQAEQEHRERIERGEPPPRPLPPTKKAAAIKKGVAKKKGAPRVPAQEWSDEEEEDEEIVMPDPRRREDRSLPNLPLPFIVAPQPSAAGDIQVLQPLVQIHYPDDDRGPLEIVPERITPAEYAERFLIYPYTTEADWTWSEKDEQPHEGRITRDERRHREKYLFKHFPWTDPSDIVGVRGAALQWAGKVGFLYRFATSLPDSIFRRVALQRMERACVLAQVGRIYKNGKQTDARPKDRFHAAGVKLIEGNFYASFEQMNQTAGCDMILLTVIPRPGVKGASLAAAWLEVPREMDLIMRVCKSWTSIVRIVLCVETHPGPNRRKSKVKPAAGEFGGAPAPAPRDDMGGVVEADRRGAGMMPRPPAPPRKPGAKAKAKSKAAAKHAANIARLRKTAEEAVAALQAEIAAQQKKTAEDTRDAGEGLAEEDRSSEGELGEAMVPPVRSDGQVTDEMLRMRVAVTNPELLRPIPSIPAAKPAASSNQARLLQAAALINDNRPHKPAAVRIVDTADGPVIDRRPRPGESEWVERGPGGAAPSGAEESSSSIKRRAAPGEGEEDSLGLGEGGEEGTRHRLKKKSANPSTAEDASESIRSEEPWSEDEEGEEEVLHDLRHFAPEEDVEEDIRRARRERDAGLPSLAPYEIQAHQDEFLRLHNIALHLSQTQGGSDDQYLQALQRLEACEAELRELNIPLPTNYGLDDSSDGEEENEEDAVEDEGYQKARQRDKAAANADVALLKWHPHYHASITFTTVAGALPDIGFLKAKLMQAGMKDVHIKRAIKGGAGAHFARVERYTLVGASCPVTYRMLEAVGHCQKVVSRDGTETMKTMRLAVEWTNTEILARHPQCTFWQSSLALNVCSLKLCVHLECTQ